MKERQTKFIRNKFLTHFKTHITVYTLYIDKLHKVPLPTCCRGYRRGWFGWHGYDH